MIETTQVVDGWPDVVGGFERALVRKRFSPDTVRTYLGRLHDLVEFLVARECVSVHELNRDLLEKWQDQLAARELRPATCSMYSTAVRRFLSWAADHDLVDAKLERALARIHVPDGVPRPLPPQDLELIRAYLYPRRPHMGIVALRDRALFFYLVTSGARVSEALQVRRDDYLEPIVRQKGGTSKVLRIPPATAAVVSDYVEARRDDSPWLWISHKTNAPLGRLGPPGVREVWRKLAMKLGLRPWTTHQLRHTCCTEMLEAEVPSLVVMDKMGHHGLGTQHIYGQVRDRQRQHAQAAMQRLVVTSRPDLLPRLSTGSRL